MHNTYLLKSLDALRVHLSRNRTFYQVMAQDGEGHHDYQWQQVVDRDWPPLLSHKPTHSAKAFFFAEQEPLYVFDGQCFRETLPSPDPFVLFGVQSCDLMAIHYQDIFFEQDPYYQSRREQVLLVGLDCTQPCEHGFCPTVNAGPSVRDETADLVLHPLDDNRWLLVALSVLGKEALHGFALDPASPHDISLRWDNISHCEQAFPDHQYLTDGINKLNSHQIPDTFWQQIGTQCLGCSGCTTLCPTCSCFGTRSVADSTGVDVASTEALPAESATEDAVLTRSAVSTNSRQVRFWDSCLYEGFQREASFHNPAKLAGQRVKRFWYHKFSDDFTPDFGRYGCIGCGRCEQTCPGVIGVHSVMKRIADDG
ncbi:4Fe-4S dicluster domain-containing protein [Photobacterium nomapromontoriensis]|uniref:4Fe-4S dicluster domain-containing protein n=1 Tax=Photobacterium nomapromontoriensis TaxID=2910237 RepID=UPI003D0CEC3F